MKQNLSSLHQIVIPISLGELIDKITILHIKAEHVEGVALKNVKRELEALEMVLNDLEINIDPKLVHKLQEINAELWQIEDAIRIEERQKSFDENFIQLARSVYRQNDRRALIKKEINTIYRSELIEEKSYQSY